MFLRPFLIPILLIGEFVAVAFVSSNVGAMAGESHALSADSLAALEVQVHLDRSGFSPGILDGRDGQNTATAIYWFQYREGLPTTGTPDSITRQSLALRAGPSPAIVRIALTSLQAEGPSARLAEHFQVHPDMLRRLNPGVDMSALEAGDSIRVPNVGERPSYPADAADRIVVSAEGGFVQVLDGEGAILYHFPATLGSACDPIPAGPFSIVSITDDPFVWIALTQTHHGIHGTSTSEEAEGAPSSNGCVGLTDWDASYLALRVSPGLSVEFVERRSAPGPTRPSTS